MSYSVDDDVKPPIIFDEEPRRAGTHAERSAPAVAADPQGEQRVRRTIEDAAPKNTTLLNDIKKTEEAVSALNNTETRLSHAQKELLVQNAAVQQATLRSKSQQTKYTRKRDSLSTRWYYILTRMRDNLDVKIREAEQEFHEALAAQQKSESRQRDLQRDIDAIEKEKSELSELAEKHMAAHEAIDKLYSSIFTGPTPGFPDEDEREERLKATKTEHEATTSMLKAMSKACKQMQGLKSAIEKAQAQNNRADYEVDSAFFVSDYVQIFVEKSAQFIGRAQQLHRDTTEDLPKPLNRNFAAAHEDLGRLLSDVRQRITATLSSVYPSRRELSDSAVRIASDLKSALEAQAMGYRLLQGYQSTAKRSVTITARALEDARQALQEVRQGAFEITVGFGAAAPAYHECCDRAEGYENDALAQCQRIEVPTVDDIDLPPPPSYERAVG